MGINAPANLKKTDLPPIVLNENNRMHLFGVEYETAGGISIPPVKQTGGIQRPYIPLNETMRYSTIPPMSTLIVVALVAIVAIVVVKKVL